MTSQRHLEANSTGKVPLLNLSVFSWNSRVLEEMFVKCCTTVKTAMAAVVLSEAKASDKN